MNVRCCLYVMLCLWSNVTLFAQEEIIPKVFDISQKFVFGKYTNGEWKSPPKISGKYRVYRRDMWMGMVSLKSQVNKDEEPCFPDFLVAEKLTDADKVDYVAVEGGWNHLPRVPKKMDAKQASYRETVSKWATSKKISPKNFEVQEVVQVDIDNDKSLETIIVAGNITQTVGAVENDFSVILLQKVQDGETIIIPIAEYVLDAKVAKDCSDETPCYSSMFRFSMCLDINNDGILEIIIADIVHEGMGKSIFEWKEDKLTKILDWGCGV